MGFHGERARSRRKGQNESLRDLGLPVFNNVDERRLEVVVDGLPLFRGAQLYHSRVTWEGVEAVPRAGRGEGRARLVVLGGEVGGRFSDETAHFLRSLASAKVHGMSELLKRRAHAALMRRWSSTLGCTAARSYALSLLDRVPAGTEPIPSIHEVVRDHRHEL